MNTLSKAAGLASGGGGMLGDDHGGNEELPPEDLRLLFVTLCRALVFDALRMKPREKQFALLLASESFGEGSAFGAIDTEAWRVRLPEWRSNELKAMLENWRRAGWLVVDVTENTFRLAPDQFPGWANVQAIQKSERRVRPLNLMTEDDLHKTFAKISQLNARDCAREFAKKSQVSAKFSQEVTKISQPGEPTEGTFNRLTSERINVKRSAARSCENFATAPASEAVEALKNRVRHFVGEADWTAPEFWNCGLGWRGRLFTNDYAALEGALSYCVAGLQDRDSGVKVQKTKGAMLWYEFQRLRAEAVK